MLYPRTYVEIALALVLARRVPTAKGGGAPETGALSEFADGFLELVQ